MPVSSGTACSTPPAPARSSPRRRPTRCSRPREAVDGGAGVLFIVKNYEGDVMNFDMAAEMCRAARSLTVITNDDVAVENSLYTTGRRGVAGTLVVEKIVGAAAEAGAGLAALKALGDDGQRPHALDGRRADQLHRAGRRQPHLRDRRRRDGDGRRHPRRARPPPRRRCNRPTRIAEEMVSADPRRSRAASRGAEALLFVNGFGGTPAMELYLMYNAARRLLDAPGLDRRALAGRHLRDLARHGRLLDHRDAARRGADAPLGCAGAHRGAALGCVMASGPIRQLRLSSQAGRDRKAHEYEDLIQFGPRSPGCELSAGAAVPN